MKGIIAAVIIMASNDKTCQTQQTCLRLQNKNPTI